MKRLLTAQTVMANFETDRGRRLYVDQGPTGVVFTVAQEHTILVSTKKVWRPMFHTSRAMTSMANATQRWKMSHCLCSQVSRIIRCICMAVDLR